MKLKINKIGFSSKCEVCHQSDYFDKETSFCHRCSFTLKQLNQFQHLSSTNLDKFLTKQEASRRITNRFDKLNKNTSLNKQKMLFYYFNVFIIIIILNILLASINSSQLGLLIVFNFFLLLISFVFLKQQLLYKSLKTSSKNNNLTIGLLSMAKAVRKYRQTKKNT